MHRFIWDFEPEGNVEHVGEHGLTPEEVESAFDCVIYRGHSRSSGLPLIIGELPDNRRIAVIFQEIDESSILPLTAYKVSP